jgi:hypothetical protein
VTRRAGCQKATTELSLQNLQMLSHLRYPTDTRQLTSPQGEADGVSDGGMTLQALGGVNLPCGWYRVRGQLPSTRGGEHTHSYVKNLHFFFFWTDRWTDRRIDRRTDRRTDRWTDGKINPGGLGNLIGSSRYTFL